MEKITTNKINLLLILPLCLGCASALYAAQHDKLDDQKDNDADNAAYHKGKDTQPLIIKRPTADFQPLLKKGRPPGGSSTDIQYFREVKSGGLWIGKCNINAFIGANNHEEYREALGLAIYRFFGITTPEFAVSVQPVAPSVYVMFPPGDIVPINNKRYCVEENRPCIHIMTQFLEGFSTCGDAFKEDKQDEHKDDQKAAAITDNDSPFMRAYKRAAKAKQPFYLAKNGKKYPLQGLGTMLALANFIYDMDCIGKSGGNLGYLIKGPHAQVVKIDPGMAFSFLENHTNKKFHHNPMDRKTFFGTDESATLGYNQLTPVDQQAFAAMAKRILQTPREKLRKLIYSIVVPGGWQKEIANQLLDHLLARKFLFLAAFAPEIDDNLRQEIMEAKHRLVGTLVYQKDNQKQSKEQIAAYKKALAAVRAWEAKVAANRLIQQKNPKNNQAQKPSFVKENFQLPANARRDLFTGRQQERAAMAAFFGAKRKQPCAFQAITGVGGMGKTHLALHYAHACTEGAQWVPHRYDAILWFYAEAGLESQFHELAKVWGKKDCKTTQEAVAFVYMILQQQNRSLLVFDNAEQSQAVAPYLPPQHQKGALDILITTRNPALNLPYYGKPTYITLAAFTKKESRTYTQKVLGNKKHSQQAMDALWETVSGLPLALNHALQYIAKGKCTLEKYPARFAQHQLSVGTQLQASPVVTSVLLSVLTLREGHPLIEPLLVAAAYLAPEKIPSSAVFSLLDAKITKQAKEQALAVLHKFGLLTLAKDGNAFDFHRLVQQVLREWHRSKKGKAGHEALLKDWMAYFDKNLKYDERDLKAIHRISPLIPHAYAIADADSSSAAIQKAQAKLYFQIGGHQCFGIGHYDRAKQCYQKALRLQEKHYGADHPETASTMTNLGTVLCHLGDYAQAKQCYQKALIITEKHYGAHHPETGMTIANLGNVLQDLGDYAQAKQYYQKALKINEKHYGVGHIETAGMMGNLGNVLRNLGEYALAKEYLEKALKIKTQHYGADHPQTANTMMNLGSVLLNLGDYAQAKQCYQKALKIFEKHYGADHPNTARTIMNLGIALSDLGDYAQAKQCYQKALKIQEKHYGADHPSTAGPIENLGTVLKSLGDYAQAKQCYQKALKIQEKHYGADHPSTAGPIENLGNVLKNLGDYAQAKQCLEKALKINEKHYGADHPRTASTIENLGNVLQDLGDYTEAKQCYQKALKIQEKHYGADHPSTAITIENLGTVLQDLGDYTEAKQCYQKALKIKEKHYGPDHPTTARTIQNLGNVLDNQGDYAQAKQCYQKALKINTQHYGADHPETAITIENLGTVLANLGDYAQAKQYLQKALKIQEKHYGAHHPTTAMTIENLGSVLCHLGDYAQAKQCLEKALRLHEKHYGEDHPTTAMTIQNLGSVLANLGDYAQAKQYYQKALKIIEKHYGADHPDTAMTIENLGSVLFRQGDYAEAKTYLEKALKIKEKHYGPDHPTTAMTMGNLGNLFKDLGQYEKAREYYEKTIAIFTKHYGPNHAMTKKVKGLLRDLEEAVSKNPQNQPTSALGGSLSLPTDKPNTNKLYKVHKRPKDDSSDDETDSDSDNSYTLFDHGDISLDVLAVHFKNNPTFAQWIQYMHDNECDTDCILEEVKMDTLGQQTVISINNILFNNIKKYIQATQADQKPNYMPQESDDKVKPSTLEKEHLEKKLKIKVQHYGVNHPETAITMHNLGKVVSKLGDYPSAKTYLEKALNITAPHYGANHPNTANTMNNLGLVLSNLGNYAEARKYLEKALKIKEQHYGADHPSTAITMNNLGNVLLHLDYYTQAKTYYEKALKIQEQHYGATHPSTASTMSNLGSVFQYLGNYAEARKYLEKALKIKEQHYGTDHLSTASTMSNLGDVLSDLGDYPQAMTYLEKALKINVQHYGDDHPNTAITMGTLGVVLENLGQYEKARECYQQNIKVFTKHYGVNHSETKRVKHNLAILNDKDDKFLSSDYLLGMLLLASMGVDRSTDKPNKMYKVNKRPKDNCSDEEKDHDSQEKDCIVM